MKSLISNLTLGALVLTGCGLQGGRATDEDGVGPPNAPIVEGATTPFEVWLDGLPRDPIVGAYVVDGDRLLLGRKNARAWFDRHLRRDALILEQPGGVDARWMPTAARALTYCVSSTFGAQQARVVDLMRRAAEDWEASAHVDFVHLSAEDGNCDNQNAAVVFDVSPTSDPSSWARAFFPDWARADRSVVITTGYLGWNDAEVLGMLRHELGHALGFRHEHTRPDSGQCHEDDDWRPLTGYDSTSVMHYSACGGAGGNLTLSPRDRLGALAVYGPPRERREEALTLAAGDMFHLTGIDALPGSTIEVSMGGTGDGDLYARFGAEPTRQAFDCRPFHGHSDESCSLTVPAGGGPLFIAVDAFTAADVVLDWTYAAREATLDFSEQIVAGDMRDLVSLDVQPGSRFEADLTTLAGDPDLYVRFDDAPDRATWDCRPYLGAGGDERCALVVPPGASVAYVAVDGYTDADIELAIRFTPAAPPTPANHSLSFDGALAAGEVQLFGPFAVPDRSTFEARLRPGPNGGDADLYVRFDGRPDLQTFDCRPFHPDGDETCSLVVPAGADSVDVMVRGYTAADFTLTLDLVR